MSFEDEELIGEFVVESNEHLSNVENQFLEIEAAGADIDVDLVNTVFRAVHSVKGAAGFLGLDTINKLAHSLENVLNMVRNKELVPNGENINVMLSAADTLRNLINNTASSNEYDASPLITALTAVENGEALGTADTGAADAEAAPTTESASEEPDESSEESSSEAATEETSNASDTQESAPAEEPPQPIASSPVPTPIAPPKPPATPAPAPVDSSIRVAVSVLDQLMNLAGELVLSRNQLMQAIAHPDREGLDTVAGGLDHVTSELQEAIMQTRMQPIGNVFGKFPRIVRDLSSKLGKQCQITVEGKDVEVDKTIVEAIGDPLTHLIRNSVDHGVEEPAKRTAAGKSAQGSIFLRAFHKAGKVCIEIQDDGAGINPAKLKEKAVAKGILSEEHALKMTDREAVRLIFHPGFSMAEKVSDVSGRGVGMDVVRTNIEKLGGIVDVESKIGVGTTICVTLPLTLAIIPSMIVRCSGERFAIPQANIAELVRIRSDEEATRLSRVKSGEVLRIRGSLLPLVRLETALSLNKEEQESEDQPVPPRAIIVVETGQVRYGLMVDGISDSEEIVVKPLGRHINSSYLAGATILGDGRIALILDVAGIASQAGVHLVSEAEESEAAAAGTNTSEMESQRLLLFHSDPEDQFAIPMEIVARIERVSVDHIDTVGGRELLQYRGVSLPLISVEEVLDVRDRPESKQVYVIVFTAGNREIGLIAPSLDDIREVSALVDEQTFRAKGVAGSLVYDEKTIRLLNVFELAEAIHPEWFARPVVKQDDDQPKTILVAEDSTFFRNQVKRFLADAGFEILEAVDGQEAWEVLNDNIDTIDIVVTDIEMPRLNGFDLCRRIRQEPATAELPVIALTSLSSEDDVKNGKEIGFNDYQVKMHRENLLAAVQTFLKVGNSRSVATYTPSTTLTGAAQ